MGGAPAMEEDGRRKGFGEARWRRKSSRGFRRATRMHHKQLSAQILHRSAPLYNGVCDAHYLLRRIATFASI